jgi:tetratricopeptide (TPR) repeat protein
MLATDGAAFYRCRMKLVGICAQALRVASIAVAAFALAGCPNEARNDSITLSNAGSKAYGQKQIESAIASYKQAVAKWDKNHTAWFGLGAAYAEKQDWTNAADAMSRAVQLMPDIATYQQSYGTILYNKAINGSGQGKRERDPKKPDEAAPDLSSVNFEKPLQHLQEAVKLNSDLWRAHYYIGRIYRDTGKSHEAAIELSNALKFGPPEPAPWVALAELYYQWDYTEQGIQVAELGTTVVPGFNEKSDIWYEVGMGYNDKRFHDRAIEAFTKAIEAKRDNQKARFQRGQAYFRKGDYGNAKRDLEDFSKAGGPSVEFPKQQASKMLIDIAARSVEPGSTPIDKPPPSELVNKSHKRPKGR